MKARTALCAGMALALAAGQAVAQDKPQAQLGSIMDSVFGAGNWRLTGGYRTPERENELRAQGALTVPPGALSRHSMGRPGAPGAYDVVVNGMSPAAAAAKLRSAGAPFRKYSPKGSHGTQGPHLHIEPASLDLKHTGPVQAPLPSVYFVSDPSPAERALTRLHGDAARGDASAQLRLGQAYALGRGAPRDLIAAHVWTTAAAGNPAAATAVRDEAALVLAALGKGMKAHELAQAGRFARPVSGSERCVAGASPVGIVLLVSGRRAEAQTGCEQTGRPPEPAAPVPSAPASGR